MFPVTEALKALVRAGKIPQTIAQLTLRYLRLKNLLCLLGKTST